MSVEPRRQWSEPACAYGAGSGVSRQSPESIASGVVGGGSVGRDVAHQSGRDPPGTPPRALEAFKEPLLLVQIRPQLDAAFAKIPGGLDLLQQLLANVRLALVHGLHAIFLMGAILMVVATIANMFLREVPLRKKVHDADAA